MSTDKAPTAAYTGLSKKVHALKTTDATHCGAERAKVHRMTIRPTTAPVTCPKCLKALDNGRRGAHTESVNQQNS